MKDSISSEWVCKDVITDMNKYYINGINIWDSKWIYTGEYVTVVDPSYNQKYTAQVLNIIKNENEIKFLAVEFSSNVWGIYLMHNKTI